MTDTFIQLPADGTGKKHRSWENTVGSDDVHATAGVITAPDGTVLSEADGVEVQGGVASGDADSGNPVKVGGVYNSGGLFLTDGQRGDLQMNEVGAVLGAVATDAGGGRGKMWLDSGSSGVLLVATEGMAAEGTADSAYPVKVGGRYDTALPTLTNGDVGNLQLDANGRLLVAALPAGTNNIGDVDVASLPGTVASDITAIKTATEVIDNAIAGAEMQVDVVGSLPAGNANIGDVDVASLPTAATATLSNVATSNASATLLASNAARKGAVIYNDSLVVMYVKFGTTASATSFTYYLAAGATLELPSSPGLYTGRIDGILASSTGTARVTELT